jgi:SAM-dependent methyltransferase
LKKIVKGVLNLITTGLHWRYDAEGQKLIKLFRNFVQTDCRVLDVGCGYGKNIKLLSAAGYTNITGVDVNPEIIKANRAAGLNTLTAGDFKKKKAQYDAILFSHVIEHFAPENLIAFMNFYLSRLKDGGVFIILTPLHSPYFYDDFDHVKPYQVTGMLQVFGGSQAQIQYYGGHKVTLLDLWFRKNSFEIRHHKALYFRGFHSFYFFFFNFLSHLIFLSSFRILGKVDGWAGVFEKRKI